MKTKCLFALSFFLTAGLQSQLISSFSGGDSLSVGPGTAGYEFTASAPLAIAALGLWDDSGTGLSNAHAIGLWDSGRNLLATVTVSPSTAVDVGGFWYANLAAPLTLAAGGHYVLAARFSDNDFDFARGNVPTVSTDPRITLGPPVLSSGSGFDFPNLELPQAAAGFFGPNALFAAVPEPSSALFMALLLVLAAGATNIARAKSPPKGELAHAKRRQPLAEVVPAANRPPVTPGNEHGNRPVVPPGLANYGTP